MRGRGRALAAVLSVGTGHGFWQLLEGILDLATTATCSTLSTLPAGGHQRVVGRPGLQPGDGQAPGGRSPPPFVDVQMGFACMSTATMGGGSDGSKLGNTK